MGTLSGLRVVVTRAVHQAEELAAPLRKVGAEVLLLPMIEIAAPEDSGPLEGAAANCNNYDWIIFTSVNAVEAFASVVPPAVNCTARIATVGEATRNTCERHGFSVSLTPARYVAEALVASFAAFPLKDARILIPSAAVTRDVIPVELRKLGAVVHVVEAYRNVLPANAQTQVAAMLCDPYPDWVLFTSSSTVQNLVSLAGASRVNRMRVASIGPATTATGRRLGLTAIVEAKTSDVAGLIRAIKEVVRLASAPRSSGAASSQITD